MMTLTETQTTRQLEERTFHSTDGTELFYRYWPSPEGATDRAVILLHRGHEHSGRIAHVAEELNLPDHAMFAWDARGNGHSPAGPDPNFGMGRLVEDLDAFVRYVSTHYRIPVENISIVAQSVGAVVAATWVHDYAPKIRALVLASPAFKVKLYVPFARPGLALLHSIFGNFRVNSYVKARYLTHDPARVASYNSDPLITRPISVKLLLGLYQAADRVVADAHAIQVPTQVLISGADWVVHHKPQHQFFDRLGSTVKEKHVFPGFFHDTLGEKDRGLAIAKARNFIAQAFASERRVPSLLDADKAGFTKDEFDRLREPLSPLSPKGISFAISRIGLKTGGQLSAGIRVGLETGFDSGSTLDYVYRNQASGSLLIGKVIDWFYLNSTGWKGIRTRKENMERMLGEALRRLQEHGQPARIVDIAAGHGRYVLDAITESGRQPDDILLRDYSDLNVRQGSKLIAQRNLQSVARFEQGDAFNRASLAAITPRPTLGVVSGLYELFPDNHLVRESLAGLAATIEPGGYLVYTGQPWHPQLEFIARVLSSHRANQPWIMRRRTQAEMDELVENAGFTKLLQLADEEGIFTVSLARRTGA